MPLCIPFRSDLVRTAIDFASGDFHGADQVEREAARRVAAQGFWLISIVISLNQLYGHENCWRLPKSPTQRQQLLLSRLTKKVVEFTERFEPSQKLAVEKWLSYFKNSKTNYACAEESHALELNLDEIIPGLPPYAPDLWSPIVS